ncbi:MAG: bifunctional DNA-formamidopyrimidine glycosylase/DNA-(apurinic or apyrimidinic site) lyase [Candidatus Latescibacterota bacterium]|nr:bifunctional DNA-formamidopyrimidine glycosylase/DNA-(apurinic or apyrimidinic site) lyase [Candidatus Latescibacterota bacterium]
MPELPEVETVRSAMAEFLMGRRVQDVWCSGKRLREPLTRRRVQSLMGDRFLAARRRAKYLLLDLESGRTLLVHLGMTGNLIFRHDRQLHDHLILQLDSGPPLVYADPRRFGLVLLLDEAGLSRCRWLQRLGVEPLSDDFTAEKLHPICRRSQRLIKSLLLDGTVVVGVGNIYANEALFRAGIRPTLRCPRLSKARVTKLVEEVRTVLRQAIARGGTTISDYLGSGSGGRFQQELAVYGRKGEPCRTCGKTLKGIVVAGRSTVYCPCCQH